MMWHVIPQSLDAGELGIRIDADSAEAAAALAVAGPYAAHRGQPMVVRWDVRYDRHGDVLFARCAEVLVADPQPAVERPVTTERPAVPEPEPMVVTVAEMPLA